MTISQLQIIDKLPFVRIEAHSHIHPIMPNCTESELMIDTITCKKLLEDWLNRPITAFAYPNGDFGEREKASLKSLGFSYGFANYPSILEPVHLNDLFKLPRVGFLEGASKIENQCRMLGIWHKNTASLFKR
jgi:peptidoglycan/xylan/chitin deacetylase (PgdA/CDA1 family)